MPWHREITRQQWRTLVAAQLGWMLDAMDVMLYSFALTAIRAEFHLSSAAALAFTSIFFVAGGLPMLLLPETRGQELR
jgi:MFS family permease